MRLSYAPETDSLYIHLVERPSTDSDEVADDMRSRLAVAYQDFLAANT